MVSLCAKRVDVRKRLDLDAYELFVEVPSLDGATGTTRVYLRDFVFNAVDTAAGAILATEVPMLDKYTAQMLLQALWDEGLRPNQGEGSAGHVKALQDHLADMRKLAFAAHIPDQSPDKPRTKSSGGDF